jgi:hypothetical protein
MAGFKVIIEGYANELMGRALAGTNSQYLPDPRPVNDPNAQICDGLVLAGDSLVLMEYKGSVFRGRHQIQRKSRGTGGRDRKKTCPRSRVEEQEGSRPARGGSEDSFWPGRLGPLSADRSETDKACVPLYRDPRSYRRNDWNFCPLKHFLDEMLDRSAFPSIEIRPLFCSEIEALEDVTELFENTSLPQILDWWFFSNTALLKPLQAVDFGRLGSKENEWLHAEWVAIYKNVVKVLFPNQDHDAVVAKGAQFETHAFMV